LRFNAFLKFLRVLPFKYKFFMALIDTHSHVYLDEFRNDRSEIIKRAENEGVESVIMPAIDSSTHSAMFEMETQFPACHCMMGVHPCSIKDNYQSELKIALDFLSKRKFVAVGEIGLDYYWDKTFITHQKAAFNEQIKWALDFDIPIVIHSRDSIDDCISVVRQHQNGKLKGVFHCFSGSESQAKEIIELGFYLGIGGVVTFKNSGLDKVMQNISLDHAVLETDAPYLAPVPFRGKRNEPSYLKYVVEKLSGLKNISKEQVAEITSFNARKLFSAL
jgi:TatD DNase family protein